PPPGRGGPMKILQGMPVGDAWSIIAAGPGNEMSQDGPLGFHVPTLALTMVEPGQYPPSARASATRFMKMTPVNLAGDTSGMALADESSPNSGFCQLGVVAALRLWQGRRLDRPLLFAGQGRPTGHGRVRRQPRWLPGRQGAGAVPGVEEQSGLHGHQWRPSP